MFYAASRLADRSRVWVERSIHDGIDGIMDELFGAEQGRPAAAIAPMNARRFADSANTCPISGFSYGSTLKHPEHLLRYKRQMGVAA
jgi:hypothetical protein|tara:strand:+ start:408 stop:668 length:261 start_codon:yes stop_codon:yes gene_type:complete